MKYLTIIVIMGLFSFFSKKDKIKNQLEEEVSQETSKVLEGTITYEQQLEIFKSLGYEFNPGLTQEIFYLEVGENLVWKNLTSGYFGSNYAS